MSTLKQKAEQILVEKNKLTPDILKQNKKVFNIIGSLVVDSPSIIKYFKTKQQLFESQGKNFGDLGIVYVKGGYTYKDIDVDEYVSELYVVNNFTLTEDEFNYIKNLYNKRIEISTAGSGDNSYIELQEFNNTYKLVLKLKRSSQNEQGENVFDTAIYDLEVGTTYTFNLNETTSNIEKVTSNVYATIWMDEYGYDAENANPIIKKLLKTKDTTSYSEDNDLWVDEYINGVYMWNPPNWYVYGDWEASYDNEIKLTDDVTLSITANSQDRYNEVQDIQYCIMHYVPSEDDYSDYKAVKITCSISDNPLYFLSTGSASFRTVSNTTIAEFENAFKEALIEYVDIEPIMRDYVMGDNDTIIHTRINILQSIDADNIQYDIPVSFTLEDKVGKGIYFKSDKFITAKLDDGGSTKYNILIESASFNELLADLETVTIRYINPYDKHIELSSGVTADIQASNDIVDEFKSFYVTFNTSDKAVSIYFEIKFPESEAIPYSIKLNKNSSGSVDVWGATESIMLDAMDSILIEELTEKKVNKSIPTDVDGYNLDVEYTYLDENVDENQQIVVNFVNNNNKPINIYMDDSYYDVWIGYIDIYMGEKYTMTHTISITNLEDIIENKLKVSVNENAPYHKNIIFKYKDENNKDMNIVVNIAASRYHEDEIQDVNVTVSNLTDTSSIYITPENMEQLRVELLDSTSSTYKNITPKQVYEAYSNAQIIKAQGYYKEQQLSNLNDTTGTLYAEDSSDMDIGQDIVITFERKSAYSGSYPIKVTLEDGTEFKMLPYPSAPVVITLHDTSISQAIYYIEVADVTELSNIENAYKMQIGPSDKIECIIGYLEPDTISQECIVVINPYWGETYLLTSDELGLDNVTLGWESVHIKVENAVVEDVIEMANRITFTLE